jgi:hypothetical protein
VSATVATAGPVLDRIEESFVAFERERQALDPIAAKERALMALIESHRRSLAKLGSRRAKVQARIDEANPHIRARYLQPLADALLPYFPGTKAEIRGPFGLGATACIAFVADRAGQDGDDECRGYLEVRLLGEDRHELGYVVPASDTGRYPPGSIGYVNGLHHEVRPITAAMALDELAALLRCDPP